jgi:hypothetical protein
LLGWLSGHVHTSIVSYRITDGLGTCSQMRTRIFMFMFMFMFNFLNRKVIRVESLKLLKMEHLPITGDVLAIALECIIPSWTDKAEGKASNQASNSLGRRKHGMIGTLNGLVYCDSSLSCTLDEAEQVRLLGDGWGTSEYEAAKSNLNFMEPRHLRSTVHDDCGQSSHLVKSSIRTQASFRIGLPTV